MPGEGSIRNAFTLAEVLITLAIIGVVAAMTIPTLISDFQEKVTVTKLQKVYSALKNAFDLARIEHGNFSSWSWTHVPTDNGARTKYFWETYILPNLKVSKTCFPLTTECFPYDEVETLDGSTYYSSEKHGGFVLSDGTMVHSWAGGDPEYGAHVWIVVDINGSNKPNIIGNDIFYMLFRISPMDVEYGTTDENGNFQASGTYREPLGLSLYGENSGFTAAELVDSSVGGDSTQHYFCTKESVGRACGAAIKLNGWKIPDNYPHKF